MRLFRLDLPKSGDFQLRALTARAEIKPLLFAIDYNGYGMNIGKRPRIGAPLRMADIVAEQRRLAAQVTFQVISPLDHENGLQ